MLLLLESTLKFDISYFNIFCYKFFIISRVLKGYVSTSTLVN